MLVKCWITYYNSSIIKNGLLAMTHEDPRGELVIRTIAMPSNTNSNGDIFGGWLVAQMDLGASTLAYQRSKSRCATVAINDLRFIHPVKVGNVVCCYAELIKVGTTSMTIRLETWINNHIVPEQQKVAEGLFVFVAINDSGKPQPIDR